MYGTCNTYEAQSPFDAPFHETSPPTSPLLLPSQRSSHNLLRKAAVNTPPPPPQKSSNRLQTRPLEKIRPLVDDVSDKSYFLFTLVEPAASCSRVESTVFLVIEDGVVIRHKLLKPFPREKGQTKQRKNVVQRALGWANQG
ncbi:uncharacterized protein BT62DRAFT_1013233 [Guyanagaster necrorhizus]|uniref:Uncharacterized protein n=1 Tax=Guyanagaster necrorhizus TaxID=856835 RepID=A0A9P7VHD3_9AGAR|nr:uncharacterized protein BT62DRAFT_1013233 [Guyanagaster necrorhizus MCA 3950]KAG7439979.1 hypothetical protein BT62DRAFT_1013233 [Guyanagaster necrorhizus MCA 3950]